MPRKQRDYKAEYAKAKAKANASGYKSEREYKRARKTLRLPPRTSPVPKRVYERLNATDPILSRLRRESQAWSDAHSKSGRSKYDHRMSDDKLRLYHLAFVDPVTGETKRKRYLKKKAALRAYLVPDHVDDKEWNEKYW